jgi:hypothetical protein
MLIKLTTFIFMVLFIACICQQIELALGSIVALAITSLIGLSITPWN